MSDDVRFVRPVVLRSACAVAIARLFAVYFSLFSNKLGQRLEDLCCSVVREAIAAAVAGEINRNDSGGFEELCLSKAVKQLAPDKAAVRKAMNEEDDWLLTGCAGRLGMIGEVMKFQPRSFEGIKAVEEAAVVL